MRRWTHLAGAANPRAEDRISGELNCTLFMETLFTIACGVTFLLVVLSPRSPRAAAYSANLVWSAIALVVLVGTAGISLWRGNVSLAIKQIVILLIVLTITGIIPGLLVSLRGR